LVLTRNTVGTFETPTKIGKIFETPNFGLEYTYVFRYMFPDAVLRNKVDDPIFGPCGTANDVPQ
jgi:hypothetical protein